MINRSTGIYILNENKNQRILLFTLKNNNRISNSLRDSYFLKKKSLCKAINYGIVK